MPRGFGSFDLNKMMKQVKNLQSDMAKLQEQVGTMTVEASSGGGAVKVVIDGNQEVKSLTIDPEVVDPEDIEMLQDLIIAAMNEAIKKSKEMVAAEMAKLTGGLSLPGMF